MPSGPISLYHCIGPLFLDAFSFRIDLTAATAVVVHAAPAERVDFEHSL